MLTVNNDWSNYLMNFDWTHTATVRLHYKITEYSADLITTSLVKYKPIQFLFYCLENDRDDINHIHLILSSKGRIERSSIARGLGKYGKSVSYLEKVKSQEAIARYCTKHLNRGISYDLKFKHQYQ